jgi:hypothetical protein
MKEYKYKVTYSCAPKSFTITTSVSPEDMRTTDLVRTYEDEFSDWIDNLTVDVQQI